MLKKRSSRLDAKNSNSDSNTIRCRYPGAKMAQKQGCAYVKISNSNKTHAGYKIYPTDCNQQQTGFDFVCQKSTHSFIWVHF